MTFHPIARNATRVTAGGALLGAMFMLFAASGYPSGKYLARTGHSPFAFGDYTWFDTLGAVAGGVVLIYCLAQYAGRWRTLQRLEQTQDAHFFVRAGAPRWIYELLLGVAAVDGSVDEGEHDVVQQILTRELPEKVLPTDLQNWRRRIREPRAPATVARALRKLLDRDECAALLGWCRKVAAVRGTDPAEADVLRELTDILTPVAAPLDC